MHDDFYADYRYGSAAWAGETALARAGLFGRGGPQVGYHGQNALRLEGDAPLITIAGAGSGKLRDQLSYVVCNAPGTPMAVLDPRGELGAISQHVHAGRGEFAYFWNPVGLCGLPQHRCNPLDILRPESPTLHADCKFIAEGLIPLSGSANGQYFELRAREWAETIVTARVEQAGGISFPGLYRLINLIEADPPAWADFLGVMLRSRFESVRRVAAEMLTKQQDAPREFGAIMGTIYAQLGFLSDPVLLAALERPDFSLEAACDPARVSKIFFNVPAEYMGIWSPLIRVLFTVTMLYKSRRPEARRVLLLVDEAGQLGRFEALLRAFTFGRGAGVRSWACFQDAGQIVRSYGAPALQSFLGSAQTRIFFGVRDYETAKLVSDMLGSQTLDFDDPWRQEEARRRGFDVALRMMNGGDPFAAGAEFAHYRRAARTPSQQARPLMSPDEVLAMPEDRQILFISGKDLRPVYAHKHPYFTRREMAGLYLPNPHHPPADRVRIRTRFGSKWARVITEAVPDEYSLYPQYQSGSVSYIEGFRPF